MGIAFLLLVIVLILLGIERISVKRGVNSLRIRILINGTRGKSTVTGYIGNLLRTNCIQTISKVTGDLPIIKDQAGSTKELKRWGPARVTEQFKIIKHSFRTKADALVLENMTINPELQKIESRVFKPHFYVITNIRDDHFEETGADPLERVNAICYAIPRNTIVVTAENKYREEIEERAKMLGNKFIHIDDIEMDDLGLKNEAHIYYDNVAIAVGIANELGLPTESFFRDLLKNGASNQNEILIKNHKINFVNGFSVNDVPSAEILLNEVGADQDSIIIFNSRSDRPMRSKQFADWFVQLKNISKFIITGDHTGYTTRRLVKKGLNKDKILVWKKNDVGRAKKKLAEIISSNTSVIGLGNIKNEGFEIINSLNA